MASAATGLGLRRGMSRDVLVYASGDLATRALGFITVPIYTHLFAPSRYSVLSFVATIGALLSSVLILGGDTALSRFWFTRETVEDRRSLVTTWIGFLAVWSLAVCAVLALAAPELARLALDDSSTTILFWLLLASLPLGIVSRMLAQILRNEFRPVPYAITSFGVGLVSVTVGVTCVTALDLGLKGIFLGIVVGEFVVLGVRAALTRRLLWGMFDRELFRRMVRFAVPLVPVSVSFWIFTASDRVVLAKLGSLRELGYYSVAISLVSIFALLTGAVGQAWVPRAYQLYEQDRERAARVIGASLSYYVFALGLLAVTLSAFGPEVVRIISAPSYAPAARVLPLLALGAVAYGSNILTASGMTLTNRTGHLATYSAVAAVVNVVVAIALVPVWGMMGAALASAAGYAALTAAYLYVSQRLWPIALERRRLGVSTSALLLVTVLLSQSHLLPTEVRIVLPVGYVAACVLFGGLTEEDRAMLGAIRRGRWRPRSRPESSED